MFQKLKALKWRLLPLVIAGGVLLIPLVNNYWSKHQISAAADKAQHRLSSAPKINKLQGVPNRILIPSLGIDLPVVSQSYSQALKSWPVSASTANYATESALINNTHGQSLIYGHNNRSVFGPLLNIQPNTEAFVYTDNGHIFKYSYQQSQDVSPRQISIVAEMNNQPPGLNLITCDGPYFQYRHVMNFKLLQAT